MDLGIILGDVEAGTAPPDHWRHLLAQAAAAQKAGIRYLTIGQHFLYGGPRWLQPVPTLARLSAEVEPDTRLATTVLLGPLYHPVVLAEELATLDIVTEGRLIAGFGLGYRTVEYTAMGVDFGARAERLDETLDIITRMWTHDRVEYDGRHFQVHGPVHLRPWQQPRPPIWVGADGIGGVRRAARKGDAWVIGPTKQPAEIARLLEVFESEHAPVLHPIRRDLALGRDRASALDTFIAATAARYRGYADNERAGYAAAIADEVSTRVLHGTVEDCASQARALAAELPIDPIIVRPAWPGMTTEQVIAAIAGLADLRAALSEIPARPASQTPGVPTSGW